MLQSTPDYGRLLGEVNEEPNEPAGKRKLPGRASSALLSSPPSEESSESKTLHFVKNEMLGRF
jgi:hypothetical protein